MTAIEMFHWLKLRSERHESFLALKLDMSKAYNHVEWKFLEYMLYATGFPQKWCNLIMECVRSVSYSIVINGGHTEFFEPRRGLRQADPLSPYLFILCVEGLSSLIRKMERDRAYGVASNWGGEIFQSLISYLRMTVCSLLKQMSGVYKLSWRL